MCLVLPPAASAAAGRRTARGCPRGAVARVGKGCARGWQRWGWGCSCLSLPQAAPSPPPRTPPCSLPSTSHQLWLILPTPHALPGQAASGPGAGHRGRGGCACTLARALALALPSPCPCRAVAPCDTAGLQPWICSGGRDRGFHCQGVNFLLSLFSSLNSPFLDPKNIKEKEQVLSPWLSLQPGGHVSTPWVCLCRCCGATGAKGRLGPGMGLGGSLALTGAAGQCWERGVCSKHRAAASEGMLLPTCPSVARALVPDPPWPVLAAMGPRQGLSQGVVDGSPHLMLL